MTTFRKHIKSALILFLALVMCTGILPTTGDTVPEAEAATAGLYDIKVEVTVTDGADGWDQNDHYVNHKSNNGTGTQTAQSVSLSTGNMDEEKTHTFTYTNKGFPTSYTYYYEFGGGFTWRKLEFTLKVYASKAGANSWKEVMSDSFSASSSAFDDAKGTWTVNASKEIPAPASISWTNTAASVTVPKTGTATVTTAAATVYDQYGVEWYQEPYYALNTSNSAVTSSASITGVTRTTTQANTCTVSVTNAAKDYVYNNSSDGTSCDVYLNAYINSVKSTTKKITLNQVQYDVNFYNESTRLTNDTNQKVYYKVQPSYTGTPTKAADAQYTYTFDGWVTSASDATNQSATVYTASTLPVATADVSYYAHYETTVNKYDITFNNYDGTQLQYSEWDYGEMPQYNGDTPVRESDPPYKFTYVFSGWDPEIVSVTQDAIYTAYFQEILNKYEIKFVNDDGTVLQTTEVDADATPVYSGATPTKAATAQYTYTFKDWDKEIVPVTGEATYTATYDATVNNYTVTWNIDGVTETQTYAYGEKPTYADPVKAADAQYTYTFAGWTPTVTTVTGDATYIANFNKTVNKYTVKFVDANGSTVSETQYDYGTAASAVVKPANTEKHYDATNHYTYAWPTVAEVTGDAVYTEKQTATAHTLSEYSRNDATCTATGTSYLECTCGYRTTEVLPIIAHTIIDVAQVDAKCEVPGTKAHFKCSVCGALFSDAEATKPTTAAELTIAALEHNYEETITAATCTKGAYSTFTCSRCGDTYDTEPGEPLAHPYELVKEDPAATCTTNGTAYYECPVCGAEKAETVAALGHDAKLVAFKDSTCTAEGNIEHYFCSRCNKAFSDEACNTVLDSVVIAKKAHPWGDWSETLAPTCSAEGKEARSCSVCGTSEERAKSMDPDAHKWSSFEHIDNSTTHTCVCEYNANHRQNADCTYSDYTIVKNATCTEDGEKYRTCLDCEHKYTETITATGHSAGEAKEENRKESTCTVAGSYDSVIYCSVCNAELSRDTVALELAAHTEVIDEAVAPDCTNTGLTEGKHCSVCGEVLVAQETVDALGHDYVGVETKAPTCAETGVMTYTCSNDASHTYTEEIAKIAHTEVIDSAVAPDCENTGLTEGKHCSVCGEVLVAQETVEAAGHKWGAWNVITAATCTTAGEDRRDCTECDAYETVVTNALNHNEVAHEAKTPTCTEPGWDAYVTCSRCDYTTKVEKAALGHTEEIDAAVAATCTATGLTEGKHCSVCGEVLVAQEVVDALGHTEEIDAAVAPTCTETGLTEGKHCSVCGEVLVAQEVVDALGHTEEIDAAVAATCTATGLTEGKHCSVCGEVLVAQEVVDALGHTEEIDAAVAATCTVTGLTEGKHCSVCGEVLVAQEVVDALGHTEETIPAVDATCTETGLTAGVKCSVCGEILTEQEVVDALGHTEETIPAVDATCTEPGLTEGKHCSVCGVVLAAQEVVDALGHTEETIPAVDATCTETGLTAGVKCSVCGEIITAQEVVDALGHTEEAIPAVDATCTESGLTAGVKCSVCGEIITAQEEVAALGHTTADAVKENEIAATCTEAGSYDNVVRCAVCKIVLDKEHVVVDAIGHDYRLAELRRPTKDANGTWGNGYETYVCKNDSKHNYSNVVYRADYAAYDENVAKLSARLADTRLDAGVAAEIEDLLAANAVLPDRIASEQADVDDAAAALNTDGAVYLTTYKVTFVADGQTVSEQTVYYGSAAEAPADPEKEDGIFLGWNGSYTNVRADVTVEAEFSDGDIVIDIDAADVKLAVGANKQIAYTVLPTDADVEFTWTSADSSIATVDSDGVVKGIKNGATTVTVTALNGTISETITVYVYKANAEYTVQLAKSPYGNYVINDYVFYETAYINVKAGQEFKFQFALSGQYDPEDVIVTVNGKDLSVGEDNYFTVDCMTENLTILVIPAPGSGLENGDSDNDNTGTNNTAHSCWCHSSNKLLQFLWKILMFFCKIFGIESYHYCACGVAHW